MSILDERFLPPPTLWVEWRFRSNQPIPSNVFSCDARFSVVYLSIADDVFMFSDSVVSFSGDDFVFGLDPDVFHTYRFESTDGVHYTFAVDGLVFVDGQGVSDLLGFLQFGRSTACGVEYLPVFNEWDMIRYGTISDGERVIQSDPPSGFIDARVHPQLDRIAVTFNEPNFVYIDEVTVETGGGNVPVVIQTTRRENDEPDTVEIVMDRPISPGTKAKITISDGAATSVLHFTYAPGDTDGDGDADLLDMAALQNCFGANTMPAPCPVLDINENSAIDGGDFKSFLRALSGPK